MNYEPLVIRAWLTSPIAGDAPMLDAILERYAFMHDIDGCSALSKGSNLNTHDVLTYDMLDCVPLKKHTFDNGVTCYAVSSPIMDAAYETTEHFSTRMDYARLKNIVRRQDLAKLRPVTGPYTPSFEPHRVRTSRFVTWFAEGDKEALTKWLSDIHHIGGKTAAGYGIVDRWEIGTAADAWMLAPIADGKCLLMRPIPADCVPDNAVGYRPYFGAIKPPYWHPMRQMEIVKPC